MFSPNGIFFLDGVYPDDPILGCESFLCMISDSLTKEDRGLTEGVELNTSTRNSLTPYSILRGVSTVKLVEAVIRHFVHQRILHRGRAFLSTPAFTLDSRSAVDGVLAPLGKVVRFLHFVRPLSLGNANHP